MGDVMKHFLIYTNQHKDKELKVTNQIKDYLEKHEQKVTLCIKSSDWTDKSQEEAVGIPEDVDFMLVLGGDGTVLEAARETRKLHIPLIGVNLGTLGYMTEIEIQNLEESLDRMMEGAYEQECRMMLKGVAEVNDGKTCEGWALNDIVISRRGPLQVVHFDVFVNGRFLNHYQADGVIITTPTGSTGYNLSAGGPIVEPSAQLIMLTPICAHSLNQRSIILSADDVIEIEIPAGKEGKIQTLDAYFDGVAIAGLCTGKRIKISKAKQSVEFIKLNCVSFLDILHRKMNEQR